MKPKPAQPMHARLWQAIDQIGSRSASRFEWKLAASLGWVDLESRLTICPGRAASVPDPDEPLESLVVWDRQVGTVLLESSQVPAHRDPIVVADQELRLYRADVNTLSHELGNIFHFTAQPASGAGPVYRIGLVQRKGHPNASVMLLIPNNPVTSIAALRTIAERQDQTLLLLPSARWLRGLPLSDSVQVRTIYEFLCGNEEEHLTTVIARAGRAPRKSKTHPVIDIRTGDRWEDVKITFNPSNGRLQISIGQRHLDVPIWNTKKRTGEESGVTRAAKILGSIALAIPQGWKNPSTSSSKHATTRKGFQLLKNRLNECVPIADGDPFAYDRTTHIHRPRFKLEMKKTSRY
jgi:hypothetical protein